MSPATLANNMAPAFVEDDLGVPQDLAIDRFDGKVLLKPFEVERL